jgi:hypothetical protein
LPWTAGNQHIYSQPKLPHPAARHRRKGTIGCSVIVASHRKKISHCTHFADSISLQRFLQYHPLLLRMHLMQLFRVFETRSATIARSKFAPLSKLDAVCRIKRYRISLHELRKQRVGASGIVAQVILEHVYRRLLCSRHHPSSLFYWLQGFTGSVWNMSCAPVKKQKNISMGR